MFYIPGYALRNYYFRFAIRLFFLKKYKGILLYLDMLLTYTV